MADPFSQMPDWLADKLRTAVRVDTDLEAYVRTLTHAEALHCIDALGVALARNAALGITISDRRFREDAPMVGRVLRLLARRAARTRPSRPGGRAAYNHDDCSCVAELGKVLDRLTDDLRSNGGGHR